MDTQIPIIGLTARPESLVTQSLIESGVEIMLTKPVQPDKLVATIYGVVNGKS